VLLKKGPLPTLVAVVTTKYNGVVNAAPVTWFTPCSYEPPRLALATKVESDTSANIRDTGQFVLQTVPFTDAQVVHNLARKLSRGESEVEYEGLEVVKSEFVDVPRLKIALQWFECRLEQVISCDTHYLWIAEVLNSEIPEIGSEEIPLLYFGGLKYAKPCEPIKVKPY